MKLAEDELKWKKKARQHWLMHRDCNTKFYHMHVNQRRKTNAISLIQTPDGSTIMDQIQIGEVFSTFSSTPFTPTSPIAFDGCLDNIGMCVSNDMNNILIA